LASGIVGVSSRQWALRPAPSAGTGTEQREARTRNRDFLHAAVDGPVPGGLEPADADDLSATMKAPVDEGDRPIGRELDRARPPAIPPQQDESESRQVREHVAMLPPQDAGVADEQDERDVDDHIERHRVPGTFQRFSRRAADRKPSCEMPYRARLVRRRRIHRMTKLALTMTTVG
jgi:hypothetical protein